jgi:hypothetical protein
MRRPSWIVPNNLEALSRSRPLRRRGQPRAKCVFITAGPIIKLCAAAGVCVCLLLQYLIQSCARGGRRIVEEMCYEIRRAEACVD